MISRRSFFHTLASGLALLGLPAVLRKTADAEPVPHFLSAQQIADQAAKMLYDEGCRAAGPGVPSNDQMGIDQYFSTSDRVMSMGVYVERVLGPKIRSLAVNIGDRQLTDIVPSAAPLKEYAIGRYQGVAVSLSVFYHAGSDATIESLDVFVA